MRQIIWSEWNNGNELPRFYHIWENVTPYYVACVFGIVMKIGVHLGHACSSALIFHFAHFSIFVWNVCVCVCISSSFGFGVKSTFEREKMVPFRKWYIPHIVYGWGCTPHTNGTRCEAYEHCKSCEFVQIFIDVEINTHIEGACR